MRSRTQHLVMMQAVVWVAACISVTASAQLDRGPNAVGIYFDEAGVINGTWADVGSTVHCYVIVSNLQLSSPITNWWGGVTMPVPVRYELRGGGINAIGDSPLFHVWFDVAISEPIPVTPTAVLADLYCDVSISGPIGLAVAEVYSTEHEAFGCASGTSEMQLSPATACTDLPCWPAWVATINGAGPVLSAGETWGGLKALFR